MIWLMDVKTTESVTILVVIFGVNALFHLQTANAAKDVS